MKSYLTLAGALLGSFAVTFGAMYFALGGKRADQATQVAVVATTDEAKLQDPMAVLSDSLKREEQKWEAQIEAYRRALFNVDSLLAVSDSLETLVNNYQSKLAALTAEIEKAEAILQAVRDERVKKLAGIFSSMTPASIDSMAARVNDDVMVAVLLAMRERSAAKVLSALTPSRAARIARKMTVNLR